jgi:hypothetical protein
MHFMFVDEVFRSLMVKQHGVVARWQLLELGFTERQIDRRVNLCRLVPLCRSIYMLPFTDLTWERTCTGAWLVSADRLYPSALSHVTAAAIHGMPQLIASRGDRHPNPLAIVTRRSDLRNDDLVTLSSGALATSPARTAVDLLMNDARPGRAEELLRRIVRSGRVSHEEIAERFRPMATQCRGGTAHVRPLLFPRGANAA